MGLRPRCAQGEGTEWLEGRRREEEAREVCRTSSQKALGCEKECSLYTGGSRVEHLQVRPRASRGQPGKNIFLLVRNLVVSAAHSSVRKGRVKGLGQVP